MKKILVINLGSTSSKVAFYENDTCICKDNIQHTPDELAIYENILDQYEFRKEKIIQFLQNNNIDYMTLDAIISRGGHTHPIPGGTYRINQDMLDEIQSGLYGRHACDIGSFVAFSMAADSNSIPMVADPPVTDEFEQLARYSGLPQAPRKSAFHVLNQRAVAKQYAIDCGVSYEELNLIGVHMGGGVSVAVHKKGRLVDANNALYEGPFSTNRTGSIPIEILVDMCFSKEYSKEQIKKMLNGRGGMIAYLGESDVKTVVEEALKGSEKHKECIDAMIYQIGKEIGSASAVLKGNVDAIVFTGGIAYSEYVVDHLTDMIGYIAPVKVYPGEYEMQALSRNALGVLNETIELNVI